MNYVILVSLLEKGALLFLFYVLTPPSRDRAYFMEPQKIVSATSGNFLSLERKCQRVLFDLVMHEGYCKEIN